MVWSFFKRTALPRWEVPTSTGMFLGVCDHAWIIVTAHLRSSSRAFTPLHPKQVHGDAGGILLTPQLIHSQSRKVPLSFRTSNYVEHRPFDIHLVPLIWRSIIFPQVHVMSHHCPRTPVLSFVVTLFRVGSALDKTARGFLPPTRSQPRLG